MNRTIDINCVEIKNLLLKCYTNIPSEINDTNSAQHEDGVFCTICSSGHFIESSHIVPSGHINMNGINGTCGLVLEGVVNVDENTQYHFIVEDTVDIGKEIFQYMKIEICRIEITKELLLDYRILFSNDEEYNDVSITKSSKCVQPLKKFEKWVYDGVAIDEKTRLFSFNFNLLKIDSKTDFQSDMSNVDQKNN